MNILKKKTASRWVPHKLTSKQKELRVQYCRENLKKLQSGAWRFCDIVTGDETWIYLRQIGKKMANTCWLNEGGTVVRREIYESKVLFFHIL